MTDERWIVRKVRPEDADGFVEAHERAWDAALAPIAGKSLAALVPFDRRRAMFLDGIEAAADRATAWVAEHDGDIVGIAVAIRESPESVELRDLYVVPEAWGSGVAVELMNRAIESVRLEAAEAFLWVAEANARARRFYEREGWVTDGESRESSLGPPEQRYRRFLAG